MFIALWEGFGLKFLNWASNCFTHSDPWHTFSPPQSCFVLFLDSMCGSLLGSTLAQKKKKTLVTNCLNAPVNPTSINCSLFHRRLFLVVLCFKHNLCLTAVVFLDSLIESNLLMFFSLGLWDLCSYILSISLASVVVFIFSLVLANPKEPTGWKICNVFQHSEWSIWCNESVNFTSYS